MQNNQSVTCLDIHKQPHQTTTDQLIWRPSVYGVIIQDNKVLLSKQWDGYDFPGGGIERGETIETALVREVKEETGLTVMVSKLITAKDSFYYSSKGNHYQAIMLYYHCNVISGELTTQYFDEYEKQYAGMPEWIDLTNKEAINFISTADCHDVLRQAIAPNQQQKG
jgi:8-oxo-dGTP diphosphatase